MKLLFDSIDKRLGAVVVDAKISFFFCAPYGFSWILMVFPVAHLQDAFSSFFQCWFVRPLFYKRCNVYFAMGFEL